MTSRKERLGVFGGTFDPPHIGHLVAALYSFEAISLDRLLFVISNIPWQKVGQRRISPPQDRLAMVEAAIAGHHGFETSTIEIERGGESYTTETLLALQERHPQSELFLILGADAAAGIPTWRRAEHLAQLATVVVVDRPGAPVVDLPGFRVEAVTMPALGVSSTELRARVAVGASVRWQVPDAVRHVIAERRLYRADGTDTGR
ncbi:MAG: nicotinate-nucleotide adenylyltransferase [Acidimicrobiia bacterium]